MGLGVMPAMRQLSERVKNTFLQKLTAHNTRVHILYFRRLVARPALQSRFSERRPLSSLNEPGLRTLHNHPDRVHFPDERVCGDTRPHPRRVGHGPAMRAGAAYAGRFGHGGTLRVSRWLAQTRHVMVSTGVVSRSIPPGWPFRRRASPMRRGRGARPPSRGAS